MKTLEEACLTTFARVEVGKRGQDDVAQTTRMLKAIAEDMRRWAQTADEIRACEIVLTYVVAVAQVIADDTVTPAEGLLSCFIQGVIVGMEMERAEPPIPAESVPGRRDQATGYTGV